MMRALLVALLSLTLSGVARAQDSSEEAKKEELRSHVAKAKVHYDLGEFKEAADEYIIVYRLKPIPALLFNIAQAYRQGGMYDKARQFYKSYLRESPEAKNRALIEQNIREMDELLAKEKRAREAAPTGVTQPAEATLPIPSGVAQKQKPAPVEAKPPPVEAKQAEAKPAPGTQPAPPPAETAVSVAMATPQPKPAAPPAVTHVATPAPQPVAEEGGSLLTKWWFWTAVGVVAVGGGAAALTMGGNQPPASHFGTKLVFP